MLQTALEMILYQKHKCTGNLKYSGMDRFLKDGHCRLPTTSKLDESAERI
jgi:hypothetical protein